MKITKFAKDSENTYLVIANNPVSFPAPFFIFFEAIVVIVRTY